MGIRDYLYLFDEQKYRARVLPAFHIFLGENDPQRLIALLEECKKCGKNKYLEDFSTGALIDEAIGILNDDAYYNSQGDYGREHFDKTTWEDKKLFVKDQISSLIIQGLCVPSARNVNPEQFMSGRSLMFYLYRHSDWIEEMFCSSRDPRGERLEFGIGEYDALFTKEDLQEFLGELERIPQPLGFEDIKAHYEEARQDFIEQLKKQMPGAAVSDDYVDLFLPPPCFEDLQKERLAEFHNLCALVRIAFEAPQLTLLYALL